jgi:hypothetical protein
VRLGAGATRSPHLWRLIDATAVVSHMNFEAESTNPPGRQVL